MTDYTKALEKLANDLLKTIDMIGNELYVVQPSLNVIKAHVKTIQRRPGRAGKDWSDMMAQSLVKRKET